MEKIPYNKQAIWNEKMADMMKPDRYGYTLDEGVRDSVVALNLLDINTTQSDEGKNSPSPWIETMMPFLQDIYEGEKELKIEYMKERVISSTFDRSKQVDVEEDVREQLEKEGAPFSPEYKEWQKDTAEIVEKLNGLIASFYKKQGKGADDGGLRVRIEFPYRQQEEPAYPQYIRDIPHLSVNRTDGRGIDAVVAKAEMLKFTEFLKNEFFGVETNVVE